MLFQGALRAEKPLDIDAPQAGGLDAAAVALRPDVAHQVKCGRGVTVDMAVKTSHALHSGGLLRLAVGSRIELLLRKLRHQQSHALQILGIEDAAQDLLEVVHGNELALRDVAQVGSSRQKHRRRELGQEVLGQIKIDVEALHACQELDFRWRKDHAPSFMLDVRQRQKALGKEALFADFVAGHRRQLVPRGSLGQLGGRSNLDWLATGHRDLAIGSGGKIIALCQKTLLTGHHRGFVGLVAGDHSLKTLLAQEHRGDLVV